MDNEKLKLSNQALGTLMMSLQKCLMEQTDITEILKELDFYVSVDNEIICHNPPAVEVDDDDDDDDEYYEDEEEEEDEDQYFSIPKPDENGSIPWSLDKDIPSTPAEEKEAQKQYLEGWNYPTDDENSP
jgi:hypothetical protein